MGPSLTEPEFAKKKSSTGFPASFVREESEAAWKVLFPSVEFLPLKRRAPQTSTAKTTGSADQGPWGRRPLGPELGGQGSARCKLTADQTSFLGPPPCGPPIVFRKPQGNPITGNAEITPASATRPTRRTLTCRRMLSGVKSSHAFETSRKAGADPRGLHHTCRPRRRRDG